jgi:hypothetical protein
LNVRYTIQGQTRRVSVGEDQLFRVQGQTEVAGGSAAPAGSDAATEAEAVLKDIGTAFADVVGDGDWQFAHSIDGADLKRNGGALQSVTGSRTEKVPVGSNGQIWLWGVYEEWEPGDYLIVYRMQSIEPVDESKSVCFLDVCTGGNTIASRRPKASEMPQGQWRCVPAKLSMKSAHKIEYRLWTNGRKMALDRVYVFKLPADAPDNVAANPATPITGAPTTTPASGNIFDFNNGAKK